MAALQAAVTWVRPEYYEIADEHGHIQRRVASFGVVLELVQVPLRFTMEEARRMVGKRFDLTEVADG